MHILVFSLLVTCMTAAIFSSSVLACTGIRLIAGDGGAVVGRTMELGFDVQSNIPTTTYSFLKIFSGVASRKVSTQKTNLAW